MTADPTKKRTNIPNPPDVSERTGRGRHVGLDVGRARCGISVSDGEGRVATPIAVVPASGVGALAEAITKCIAALDASPYGGAPSTIAGLVVGLPLDEAGREGDAARNVRSLAHALAAILGVPLYFEDERMTTRLSEANLVAQDVSRKRRKSVRDAAAAALVLQSFLDKMNRERTAK
jgi:putative Holliday junction resolvase